MHKMDPFLRGFTEQIIDIHLEDKELRNMKAIVDVFGMRVKSRLDANVGFFLGYSYAELLMQFLIIRNRTPNKEETVQFLELLKRRFPEILNEIKKTKKPALREREDEVVPVDEIEVEPLEISRE